MERRDKEGFEKRVCFLGILEMCEEEIIREKRASYITAQSPPDSFFFLFFSLLFIYLFSKLFLFSFLRIYSLYFYFVRFPFV